MIPHGRRSPKKRAKSMLSMLLSKDKSNYTEDLTLPLILEFLLLFLSSPAQ